MRTPLVLVTASLTLLCACGGDAGSSGDFGGTRTRRDRGEAAMTIAGVAWQAERATAKLDGEKLTIKASRTDIDGGKVSRQELHLQLDSFKEPGDYKSSRSGSRFLGVGLDASKAEGGDAATTEAATAALQKAKHLMLWSAPVTITSIDDDEVRGTFSWTPPKGSGQPAITNGTFRAIRKD